MIYQTFSPKQIQAMLWWAMPKFRQYDAIICDGSVRSGKTMAMSIGYSLLKRCIGFENQILLYKEVYGLGCCSCNQKA